MWPKKPDEVGCTANFSAGGPQDHTKNANVCLFFFPLALYTCDVICVFLFKEEDEKERISQAKEVNDDEGTEHAEAAEDSLLGLSVDEVGL